jgi:hypothetical protein
MVPKREENKESQTFKVRFCQDRRCEPGRFARKLFWMSIYRHAIPLALPILLFYPRFFRREFNLMEEVGNVSTKEDLRLSITSYREDSHMNPNLLRESLRVRISGRRLLQVFEALSH